MRQLFIFGDSILKGVTYHNCKYRLCRDYNFDSLKKENIFVKNYAKMGATIQTGIEILKKNLLPCDHDTTVLLSFGGNDCDFNWKQVSAHPDAHFEPNTPHAEYIESFRQAITFTQKSGARVCIASLLPLHAPKFMNFISTGNSYENILHWLGDIDHLYRWQEYYNVLACSIARSFGCELIDLRSQFLQSANFPSLLCEDGIHPTQAGHDLIHQTIAKAFL